MFFLSDINTFNFTRTIGAKDKTKRKRLIKNIAIGTGALGLAIGAGVGANYLRKGQVGKDLLRDIREQIEKTDKGISKEHLRKMGNIKLQNESIEDYFKDIGRRKGNSNQIESRREMLARTIHKNNPLTEEEGMSIINGNIKNLNKQQKKKITKLIKEHVDQVRNKINKVGYYSKKLNTVNFYRR